jgi:hypothetical protein
VTPEFTESIAVRGPTSLLIGLVGPSGSGKTYSAMRLATGIVRIIGGHITMIDTENKRGLHYASDFRFRHISFDPPYTPARYAAAFDVAVRNSATVVVYDSASHEWEGEGGVLDMHEAELDRMCGEDMGKRERMNFPAWARPKAEHGRFRQAITRSNVMTVMCFRSKPKMTIKATKLGGKREAVDLGWQPITADDLVYEMMLRCLLPPGSDGKPRWTAEQQAEREVFKLPSQFRHIFPNDDVQLDEQIGEELAKWCVGTPNDGDIEAIVNGYATAQTQADFEAREKDRQLFWPRSSKEQKSKLKQASDTAKARILA